MVTDAEGRPLRAGDYVELTDLVGIFRVWEDDGYDYVVGELTGQAVVEIDGMECRYPTFWDGGVHVCLDVQQTAR